MGRGPVTPSRVLIVLQSAALGGMESHCTHISGEMFRRGMSVLAVVPESSTFDPLAAALSSVGARVERIDTDARRGRLRQLAAIRRLGASVRAFRPDVVHLHVGGATGGLAVVAVARLLTNAAVVITEHDVPSRTAGLRQRINRFVLDRSTHVLIAISRYNAALRLERLGAPKQKLAVVINGAPIPSVAPAERAENRARIRSELGIAPEAVVFGSAVRLAEGKGLPTLLHAFAAALREVDARLLLVGSGPLEPQLAGLGAQLNLGDRLMMVGHKTDPGPYLDAMDVFVLPVPKGSGSIALLEAMGRGVTPVITFGDGEEPVVAERTGLRTAPEDPAALAGELVRLARDPSLRDRLSHAAERHVRRHYTVARVVDDLLDVYVGARTGAIPRGLRAEDPDDGNPGARVRRRFEAEGHA